MYFKAFALTGRIADCLYTQGVALGYELLPLQGVAAYMGCLALWALLSHANFAEFSSCMVEITQHALLYG